MLQVSFARWAKANAGDLPLGQSVCVGYKVPLFLGGQDTLGNLEVIDIDVYWSLSAQLREGIRELPAGKTIKDVSIRE